jgi:thioredoxin 1
VDWDKHRNEPVSKELQVRYQSTRVMLKGDEEMGRLVAQTDSGKFKGLLDKAL